MARTHVSKYSRLGQELLSNYVHGYRHNYTSIHDVYLHPSKRKQEVEKWYIATMELEHGFDYRICTFNSHFFTCAYVKPVEQSKDDLSALHFELVYHTSTTTFIIPLGYSPNVMHSVVEL